MAPPKRPELTEYGRDRVPPNTHADELDPWGTPAKDGLPQEADRHRSFTRDLRPVAHKMHRKPPK